MGPHVTALGKLRRADIESEAILGAMASSVIVVDAEGAIVYVNAAGEQLLKGSASHLEGQWLGDLIPTDSPLFALIDQVRSDGNAVSEHGIALDTPRIGKHFVNVQAALIGEEQGAVVLTLHERSLADKIDRHLTHRGAARSVTAMAAMLAHEVKNPLSGIRGAAQLLERDASSDDQTLTRLIRDEVDRICALVDRMEVFTDTGPARHGPTNIHQVLDRVRQLAQNGFGQNVRFIERYDPSLPAVLGNRDELVQVFLNLVKNAVEAAPSIGGEIVLSTAYRHGVRLAVAGTDSRVHLPLMISVQDNGDGISEDIKPHLFDPFVTSKPKGSGLGLALVAKIINDHGGVIEIDSHQRQTVFRVMLPVATDLDGG